MIDIVRYSEILKSISDNYQHESEEYHVIELSSIALHFLWKEELREKFQDYVDNIDRELTEHEKRELRNIGVDID